MTETTETQRFTKLRYVQICGFQLYTAVNQIFEYIRKYPSLLDDDDDEKIKSKRRRDADICENLYKAWEATAKICEMTDAMRHIKEDPKQPSYWKELLMFLRLLIKRDSENFVSFSMQRRDRLENMLKEEWGEQASRNEICEATEPHMRGGRFGEEATPLLMALAAKLPSKFRKDERLYRRLLLTKCHP